MADLIDRTNKHPRFLSVLGILPNSLREIFNIRGRFWGSPGWSQFYSILLWFCNLGKRQRLSGAHIWKHACPSNQKLYPKYLKQRKTDEKVISSCKHPFHFLQKHADFSKQRPTRCPCSLVAPNLPSQNRDIRSFLLKFPRRVGDSITSTSQPLMSFSFKPSVKSSVKSSVPKRKRFHSRSDDIRNQHDLSKRYKSCVVSDLWYSP